MLNWSKILRIVTAFLLATTIGEQQRALAFGKEKAPQPKLWLKSVPRADQSKESVVDAQADVDSIDELPDELTDEIAIDLSAIIKRDRENVQSNETASPDSDR